MRQILRFALLFCAIFTGSVSLAQTTYTWTGSVDNTWSTSGNWSPARVTPAATDIIQFNSGGALNITAVPTQTIRQLLVSGSTNVSLEAATTNNLSLNGPASTANLSVASGSVLQIGTGTGVLNLNFVTTASQEALVNGDIIIGANSSWGSSVASSDFTINGNVTVNSGAAFNSANANISFNAGSAYIHARNGGTIPTASWNSSSLCSVTGITNAALSGGWAQDFGNVLWNCTSQTISHAVAGPTNVSGTLEVRNSNAQYLSVETTRTWTGNLLITGGRFAVRNTGVATTTLTVNDFTLDNTSNSNARFSVYAGSAANSVVTTLNVEGNLTLALPNNAAASLVIEYRGNATAGLSEIINLKGDFTQTGSGTGTIGRTNGNTTAAFNFNSPTTQSYSASRSDLWGTLTSMSVIANGTLNVGSSTIAPALATFTMNAGSTVNIGSGSIANGGTFSMTSGTTTLNIGTGSVANGSSFSVGTNCNLSIGPLGTIANTGTFSLGSAAVLSIGSADGIWTTGATGNIQSTSSRSFSNTATYIYNGTADQVTGNGLPASLSTGTLSIDNTGNNVSLSQNTTWSGAGTLNLLNGRLVLGTYNLTLAATTNSTGNAYGPGNMVVANSSGQMIRLAMNSTTNSSFLFPIGDDSGNYSPLTFGFTASSSNRDIRVRVVNAIHPDIISNPVSNHLNRYWVVTPSITTGTYTYTLQMGYTAPGDVTGSEASISPSLWNGASWLPLAGTASANVLNYSGTMNNGTAALSTSGTEFTGREGSLLYYRSVTNGDWSDPATWEVDTNPGFGSATGASVAPTSGNSSLVIVQAAHTVTVSAAISAVDVDVFGTLQSTTTLATAYSGITGSITFESASIYEHAADGGVVPQANWNPASEVRITGIVSATTLGGIVGQTFGAWTHNSTAQTSTLSYLTAGGTVIFKGDFTMDNTGSGTVNLKGTTAAITATMEADLIVNSSATFVANAAASAALTLNVLGDINISGGSFNLSSAAIACTVNLSGNFIQTNGTFTQTSTTVSTVNFVGGVTIFNQSGGTHTNTYLNYTVAATSEVQLNSTFTLQTSRTFIVNNGATLTLGSDITVNGVMTVTGTANLLDYVISGTGTFTANAATTSLYIGHADGINLVATGAIGNIQTSARNFGTTGQFIYNGTVAQSTGTGLAVSVTTASITIDNPAGVSLTQNLSITGAGSLTLSNGRFRLGSSNCTLGATAQLLGTPFGVNKMIVTDGSGQLINISGTTAFSFTYPVGDETGTAEYSPVTFNFSVNTTARTIGVRAINTQHPNNFGGTPNYLDRYWAITSTSNGNSYTLDVTFEYPAADINGTESLLEFSHYNTSTTAWLVYTSSLGVNQMTASGMVNTTSGFLQTSFDLTGRSSGNAYYRSATNGNWNDPATWEVSANIAGPYSPAYVAPSAANSDLIQVQNGHTVTVTATVSTDDVQIDGDLVINSGVTYTIANGTAAQDMIVGATGVVTNNGTWNSVSGSVIQIDGTVNNNLTLSFNVTGANVQVNGTINNLSTVNGTAAVLSFNSGSTYDHQRNGGALPVSTWDANSTVIISGLTTTSPTGISGYSFGHFIHNSPSQTAALTYALTSTATRFKGNFTLESTGSGSLSFKSGTGATTLNVEGNFIVNNGTLNANIGATAGLTLYIWGDYQQSNGTFNLSTASVACTIYYDGNFSLSGGTHTQTSATVSTINFRGAGKTFAVTGGTYTNTAWNYVLTNTPYLADLTINSAFTLNTSRTFIINANTALRLNSDIVLNGSMTQNGSLYMADYLITGTGAFVHNASSSFLYIGHADGIASSGATGNIRNTSTRTFGVTANYIYYGTVAQTTGTGLPASISTGTLSIDNANSVSLTQNESITSTGALNLLNGQFRLGNFNFTLSTTSTLGGNAYSGSNMIVTNGTGQLIKAFGTGAAAAFTYPLGDTSGNYTPANFGFTNNSTARSIGIRAVDATHPDLISNPVSDYLNRYWAITTSSTTGTYAYTLDVTYAAGDVTGSASAMIGSLWYNPSGTVWAPKATSLSGTTLTFIGTLNNLTAPIGGSVANATDYTGRVGFVSYYRSVADGNWTDVSPAPNNVWEVSNDIAFPPAFTTEAIAAPDNCNSAKIFITSGTNVTVNTAVTMVDMDVDGTITRSGGTMGITGTAYFKAGSLYDHAMNGGVFVSATLPGMVTWDPTATALISGTNAVSGTVTLSGLATQTLGNLEYNSSSQGASIFNLALSGTTTIQGDFDILDAGTGSLQLAATTFTLNVNGDVNVSGPNVNTTTSGGGTFNLDGNFNQTAGTFSQTSATVSTFNFRGSGKTWSQTGGTYTGTYFNYTITSSPAGSLTLNSPFSLYSGRTFIVNAGGSLALGANLTNTAGTITNNGSFYLNDYLITGTGAFSHNTTTSYLYIGHADGIASSGASGNIQSTGTRTLGATANYIYNGTVTQSTGTGLPAAITTGSLTIDNDAHVDLSRATAISSTGSLNLLNGHFRLGNFNFTLAAASGLGGNTYDNTNMIVTGGTGQLIRTFNSGVSSFTYPVGDDVSGDDYSPVTVSFSANSTTRNLGVNVTDTRHPADILVPDYISRYWSFTNTGAGTHTADVTFTYAAGDVNGTLANIDLSRYDVNAASPTYSTWNSYTTVQAGNDLSMSGVTNFLLPTANYAFDFTGRSIDPPYYYRSVTNGNWNDINTWEVSSDPTFVSPAPVGAVSVPTSLNSSGILVQTGHTVTVTANQTSIDELTVDGTLAINNAITFTIVNGAGTDLTINGTVNNSGTLNLNTALTLTSVDGTLRNTGTAGVINATAATLALNAGGIYDHNRNGGALPLATWDANSTLQITGITTTAMTTGLAAQSLGNLEINCTSQSGAGHLSLGATTGLTIKGNLTVLSTGTSTGSATLGTAGGTVTINGDVSISGGRFNLTTSTAYAVNVDGNYAQTGGLLIQTGTSPSTINFRGIDKTYNQSGGTVTGTYINYAVTNTTPPGPGALIIQSPLTLFPSRTFVVNANSTVTLESNFTVNGTFTQSGSMYLADYIVSGTGSFVNNAATSNLYIGHADGIASSGATGNIQTNTRTFGTTANYTYNGTVAQISGTGLPVTVSTLTIDNSNGVSLSASVNTVTNTLYLLQGRLMLGNFNLGLPATALIDGNAPSASNMIVTDGTGQLLKMFPATSAVFTYPVGDINGTAEYSPVTLDFTVNSIANRQIGVIVTDARHPNDLLTADYLTRYWSFTSSSAANNYTLSASFTYPAADVNGTEALIDVNQFNPATTAFTAYPTTHTANTITASGLANNGFIQTSFDVAGRSNSPYFYRSRQDGDWDDVNTWEVSPFANFASVANAVVAPRADNSDLIRVSTGHTVTVTSTPSPNPDDVEVNGTLVINSGVTFTVANGAAASDMIVNAGGVVNVNGTLNTNTAGSLTQIDGTVNTPGAAAVFTGTAATTIFGAGSVYDHQRNGGAFPIASWDANSTVIVSGLTTTAPTNISGYLFGNWIHNSTSQTAAISYALSGTVTRYQGDFSCLNTGTGSLAFKSSTAAVTLNVDGDFIMSGGTLNANIGATAGLTLIISGDFDQSGGDYLLSTANIACNMYIDGDYDVSGGTFGQTGTGISNIYLRGNGKSYTQSGGTVTNTYINYQIDDNSGTNAADITMNGPFTLSAGRTFIVNGSAALGNAILRMNSSSFTVLGTMTNNGSTYLNTSVIDGTGSFVQAALNTSNLYIGHALGINAVASGAIGNIQTNTRTFNTSANYIYNGSVAQLSGDGYSTTTFPGTANVYSLTIENAAGVTLNKNIISTTGLNLNSGVLELDNFDLVLLNTNNASAVGGNTPSATNMVATSGTGRLIKNFAANSTVPFTWPLGDLSGTAEYSPATTTFNTNATGYLGMRVTDGTHPANSGAPNYISRYWSTSLVSGLATYNYTADFTYLPADVNGSTAAMLASAYDGVSWNGFGGSSVGSNVVSISSPLTQATGSLNNIDFTGRESVIQYYYRSLTSGDWDNPSTWEVSTDLAFTSPLAATDFPTDGNSLDILVRSGHVIQVTADVDVDQLRMDNVANSTIKVNTGITFRVKDGPGTDITFSGSNGRIIIDGTFIHEGTQSGTQALVTVNSGGVYEHAQNGGTIFTATWNTGSTCLVSGITANTPGGLSQSFSNFTWNTPGLTTTNLSLGGVPTTVNGDFSVLSTGTGSIALHTTTNTINIGGDFNLASGIINLNSGSGITTMNLSGNYNQTGGEFTSTGTAVSVLNLNGNGKSYTQSGGTVTNDQINYQVNLAAADLTLNNGITLGSGRIFNVNTGRLNMGTSVIDGAGTFTLANTTTATLSIGDADGIALLADGAIGNVRTTVARNYGNAANYVYESTAGATGSGLTNANTLTFNGATADLSGNVIVTGTAGALQLNGSLVSLGNNNLTLSNTAATITGAATGVSNMLITNGSGRFFLQIPSSAWANPYVWPIGLSGNYNPVSISFTSSTTAGSLGARAIPGAHPSVGTATDYLGMYWDFSVASGLTTYTISNIDLGYNDTQVTGSESNLSGSYWSGSAWNGYPSTVDATNNIISFSSAGNLNQLTAPLNGAEYTGRFASIAYYRTVTSGNWSDPSIWEVANNPSYTGAVPATVYPTDDNSLGILVRGGHYVNVTANVSADQLTIENLAGATLDINSGVTFTLIDGIGNDLTMAGTTARLYVNGELLNNGQISGVSTTNMTVYATGVYNHVQNGGTIPAPTWAAGSTCLVSGTTTTIPGGLSQTFRNFTWNTPSLSVTGLSLAGSPTTVNENFSVESTGTGSIALHTTSNTLNVNGDFILSGGTLNLNTGAATFTTFNLTGNYIQTGGTLTATSTTGVSVINLNGVNKTYTQSGGTVINDQINYQVNTSAAVITLNSGISLSAGRNFNVNTGTLNLANQVIGGAGNFIVANTANATVQSGSPQGLQASAASGNVQATGTRTYGALANYTFNGAAAQSTGDGVSSATTLTIDNASGVTAATAISTVNLVLNAGRFTTTASNLLTVTGVTGTPVSGTLDATACVSGPMERFIPANRTAALTLLFPLGKSGSYNALEIVNPTTSSGGPAYIRAEVFNANSGGSSGAGLASLNTNRYWSVSATSGAANLTSSGSVRLTETSPVLVNGTHGIGQSATLGGTYAYKGGTVSGSTIVTSSTLNPGYGFFTIGTVGPIACPAGVLTVGPGGDFLSLSDASSVLNNLPINCNLTFELNASYDASNETFPVTFNQFTYGGGGPYTVTIRPATGVSPVISASSAGGLIVMNGADNVILDGRPAGVGAPYSWQISNTNTSGTSLLFQNDAQDNIVRYLDISGSITSGTSGVFNIGSATGTGNDNLSFENNIIHGNVARPVNLIYASGTATRDNDNITITNNVFHSWGATSAVDACAIELNSYNHSYSITGNSFYQPSSLNTATAHFGINITNTSAANSGFAISNNYFGGNASGATGTWTVNASGQDYRFCAIALNATTTGTSTIENNVIRNFSISSGTAFQTQASAFAGIFCQGGTIAIQNNTIGSSSAADNIALTLTPSTTNVHVHGIIHDGNVGVTITGNTIGGISVTNPSSSGQLMNLYGIRASTSSITTGATITGNNIGSSTIANSLRNNTGNTYSGTAQVYTAGIFCNTARPSTISNNNVYNIAYTAAGNTSGAGANRTVGIYRQFGGDNLIENNLVRNISSASASNATGVNAPVSGIMLNSTAAQGQVVRGNTIHSIESTHPTAPVNVAGLVMNTPATPTVTATVYSNNFSNPSDWSLNQVTGSEGGSPNPWSIGTGAPYPGGSCGSAATNAMYIRCTGFLCDIIGGGGPVYQTGGGAYVTDRSAYTASSISTTGYTALTLSFAWKCIGATTAYGSVGYSIDGGSTWTDLPTQYRGQGSWQCASVALPAECENISTLKLGFRWRNGTANGDVDPPFTVANVLIEGQAVAAVENAADKNFIHSITAASNNNNSSLHGIYQAGGIIKYRNNMIRLGIDASGSSVNGGYSIYGFNEFAGASEYFHNTVYIGGTPTSGSMNTYCLGSTPATGVRDIRNNIFWNHRSNSGASGKHYVLSVGTLTDLVSNYNDVLADGSGATMFRAASTDYAFLPNWHLASMQDLQSVSGDPVFVNATGNASAVDLHIQPAAFTPIESAGEAIGTVTDDYDADSRAANSPTDIGADAGLFFTADVTPPAIVHNVIPSQALCSGSITTTVEVNILDNQTGLSLVSNLPRMYFRRKTGAPTTSWSATNSVAGTYLSGTSQNSNWEFTIDYATFGITVAANDQFEYYFVAQDQASTPNIGVSQTDGSTPVHANTATLTTPAAFVFPANGFYTFNGTPLSGTVTVGTAGTYPSFNGVGGLFEAINNSGLNGDLNVQVISNISETAYTPLLRQNEFCGSGYHIRITPNNGTVRTITGTSGQTMLDIAGAFNLTFDGRDPGNLAGGGRNLIFRNTSSFPAIRFNNGAEDDTLMYCQVQSKVQNSTQGSGVITIGGPLIVGNSSLNNIVIYENSISWPSNIGSPVLTDIPQMGIQFQGSSSSQITNLQIKRNSVFNFQTTAIGTMNPANGIGNSWIGNGAIIDSNRVYQTFIIPTYQYPIVLDVNGLSYGHKITNNLIGGSSEPSPSITGTWTNNKSDGEMTAIYVNTGDAPDSLSSTSLQGNQIKNILLSGTGWGNFIGIRVENGRVRIGDESRNVIGDSLIANNIECRGGGSLSSITANTAVMGIWTQSTEEVVIANNLIANVSASAPINGYCFVDGIAHGSNVYYNDILYNTPGGKLTLRNNRVDFLLSASRLQNAAISSEGMMGIFVYTNSMNNVVEDNVVINCGVNNLVNRNVRVYGMHMGVYGSAVNQGGRVNNNTVASLANTATGDNTGTILPELHGMVIAYGNWNVYNNQIFLRNGTSGTPITSTNTFMSGIQDGLRNLAGQAANYYNNTVYMSGTNGGSGPANASYAFLRFPNLTGTVAGAPIQLRNNLLINDRNGPGNHRALGNVNSSSPATGWNSSASNYNLLFNATSTVATRWGTTDYDLAGFQTQSGGEANSQWVQTSGTTTATTLYPYDLLTDPLFGDLHILLSNPTAYGFVDALGTNVALVTTDIDNDPRDPSTPDPGADEFSICAVPVVTTPPADQTICPGASTSFDVVNGGLAPFTYAWEESTDGGITWNPLSNAGVYSGADAATLNISDVTGLGGNKYHVVITNTCGNVTSADATLNLLAAPAILTYSPPSFVNNICALSNTGFGVTASGDGLTYQWELSTDGGTT